MAGQERTCVICRSRTTKATLARVVMCGNAPVWDKDQRLPGRGAYVHVSVECLSKMAQAGKWERALRVKPGALDVVALRSVVTTLMAATPGVPGSSSGNSPIGRKGMKGMLRGIR